MKCAYYCSLLIGQLFCYSLYSQFYFSSNNRVEPELLWEAGISAGVMNCLTDLGGNNGAGKKFIKDINWNQTQSGGSVFVNADWHYLFGIRTGLTLGRVAGSDAVLKHSSGVARNRYLRNLQFRTSITEFSIAAEVYPMMFFSNRDISFLAPYLVAGIGGFHYTPRALFNNKWVDLRSLHTEGEGFIEYPDRNEYGQVSWCVPAGIGIRYDAAGLINLRFEIIYRFTGTDYLDDVSKKYIDAALFNRYLGSGQAIVAGQLADRTAELNTGVQHNAGDIRGNPANKDAWFSAMLSASVVLGRVRHK
jgi:hypothetical protein